MGLAAANAVRGSNLKGARVAVLEARHSGTLAHLVEQYGGHPYAVPAMVEAPIDSPRISQLIQGIARGRFSTVIFQTGVGAQRLFDEAARRELLPVVLERLRRCTIVARGPKPAAVLGRHGVKPTVSVGEPFTTRELVKALSSTDVSRKSVALLHYGERNRELSLALRTRGARLSEFMLYEWQLPIDLGPLQTLARDLVAGNVDAIAFTNQIQVRHLHHVAETIGLSDDVAFTLAKNVVVASIGPSCTHQLRRLGIQPHVIPPMPKMRPLISSLSDYFNGRTPPHR